MDRRYVEETGGVRNIVLDKVGQVISRVKAAKIVEEVICALHSLAVLLFPVDSALVSANIVEPFRGQMVSATILSNNERSCWWQVFYKGIAFQNLARVLLLDVASSWLDCFTCAFKVHVYDVFFSKGFTSEVVRVLVPYLRHNTNDNVGDSAVHSNIERLLVLLFLENDAVMCLAREFGNSLELGDHTSPHLKSVISSTAQIITSIPDKARHNAPVALTSHCFFKHIVVQLLNGIQELSNNTSDNDASFSNCNMDGTLLFLGEVFSCICRRGSSELLLGQVIPCVVRHVQGSLSSSVGPLANDAVESNAASWFSLRMMGAINDAYVVEKISEHVLIHLEISHVTDVEAYWTIWILFHQIFQHRPSVRSMFMNKFLLWKVFPFRCLRWIVQFAVFECPTNAVSAHGRESNGCLATLQNLLTVWSQREFVQSTSLEQQAYVTAAIGLCMENISKEELEKSKDLLHSILKGVSCRLEYPTNLIRKMASSVALVLSRIINPKNPLHLDESCTEEAIDWEFGLQKHKKGSANNGSCRDVNVDETKEPRALEETRDGTKDDADDPSDSASDSSLEPYDLTDSYEDTKRKISRLVDVVEALRKCDDSDRVEIALGVTEKLVRAFPDELILMADDLCRALVHVRCSDLCADGEESSAEDKRQKSLIALLVVCPSQCAIPLIKLLYSSNVDASQRVMILDVMVEAALELADAKIENPNSSSNGTLISDLSERQPWFVPSSLGPPGASSWKEISNSGSPLSYYSCYERELPQTSCRRRQGKTLRWHVRTSTSPLGRTQNKFPVYAATFMLPAMQGFDKKKHGVDLLGRDFIVLSKLIYMLGVCMSCISLHPEAFVLGPLLLDLIRSREISQHKEASVRKAAIFSASSILSSLHPSYIASAVSEGNLDLCNELEWIRTWSLDIAESDTDSECCMMATSCLQLHAEVALRASRALESSKGSLGKMKNDVAISSNFPLGEIKIPYSNVGYESSLP